MGPFSVLVQREMENWGALLARITSFFGGPVCIANAVAGRRKGQRLTRQGANEDRRAPT
jgi:hypothetical protein